MLETLLSKRMSPNMFDQHPNFQIDGNYGLTAGIAEMLLQSHSGIITILPALPNEFKSGEYKGFKARGDFKVSCRWSDGIAERIEIKSEKGNKVKLCAKEINGKEVKNSLGNSVKYKYIDNINGFDIIEFDTFEGGIYTIQDF